jgi:DNA-binding CsgD family transcriptional regulator
MAQPITRRGNARQRDAAHRGGAVRSKWPIAPRWQLRERVVTSLERRPFPTTLLWGPTGIGKTTLAEEIAAGITATGGTVVRIVGLEELAEVPLGAIGPAIELLDGAPDRWSNVVGAIARLSPDLILVDDAPLLDPLSAAALYQFARVHKLRCLITARDEHPITGPLERLQHEGVAERIEVVPLSESDVEHLLEERLGAPVEPSSVRNVHAMSGGNPLVLRGLALAAEEQHLIHAGRSGLVIDDPHLPAHVGAMMSARLARLDPEVRDAAGALALAQPIPREVLGSVTGADVVLESGLASLDARTGMVSLAHPLATHVLISELGDRRDAVVVRACTLLAVVNDDRSRFRATMIRMRHGASTTADELAWAAGYAHSLHDHPLAVRLADAALESETHPDALLALGGALSALGDPRAEPVLRAGLDDPDDARRAVAALRLGQHLALRSGRPDEAASIVETIAMGLTDSEAIALATSELAKWRAMGGAALAAPDRHGDAEGPGRLGELITAAMISSMGGRAEATAETVAEARPLADSFRSIMPYAGDLLDLNDFLVLVLHGRLRDADAFAAQRHDGPRADATGLWSYSRALIALHTGRPTLAAERASRAVRELTWRDVTGVRGAALALRATAEAQLGEDPVSTLDLLDDSALADVKVRLQRAEALAWQRLRAGDADAAGALVAEACAEGIEAHHPTLAALTAMVAVRADRGALVAPALTVLAEQTGSALISIIAAWSNARRPAERAAAAERLAEAGLIGPAADEWERAAAEAGGESARAWRRAARALIADTPVLLVTAERRAAPLTPREDAVARAAAARLRSQEIADDLGISVRTVDNLLARVYRKLGVRSRLDLAAALDDHTAPGE